MTVAWLSLKSVTKRTIWWRSNILGWLVQLTLWSCQFWSVDVCCTPCFLASPEKQKKTLLGRCCCRAEKVSPGVVPFQCTVCGSRLKIQEPLSEDNTYLRVPYRIIKNYGLGLSINMQNNPEVGAVVTTQMFSCNLSSLKLWVSKFVVCAAILFL